MPITVIASKHMCEAIPGSVENDFHNRRVRGGTQRENAVFSLRIKLRLTSWNLENAFITQRSQRKTGGTRIKTKHMVFLCVLGVL
jgi:hypothetical protein